jgi:hypothetical protein
MKVRHVLLLSDEEPTSNDLPSSKKEPFPSPLSADSIPFQPNRQLKAELQPKVAHPFRVLLDEAIMPAQLWSHDEDALALAVSSLRWRAGPGGPLSEVSEGAGDAVIVPGLGEMARRPRRAR